MNDLTSQYALRHELRGEFIVLRVLVFCCIIYLFLQVASMFRLFGVPGIPPLLLLGYRTLDLLVIGSFLLYCGTRLRIRWHDLPFLLMIPSPILIGIGQGNLNITFFNDIAIFVFFALKVLVIRTLITRFMEKTDFDEVFLSYARRIISRSILAALLMLMLAFAAWSSGIRFYYQAPAELTLAAALAVARGKMPLYLIILALAAMGGKRGTMIGIMSIGVLGLMRRRNLGQAVLSVLALAIVFFVFVAVFGASSLPGDAPFVRRLTGTLATITSAANETQDWLELLMFLDPSRFVEYVSLKPYLEGWALWFGNGFGFRYNLDANFLSDFGRLASENTVSNAHFTPLAIVAKFGVVGLALWLVQVLGILFSRRDSQSYFQTACMLGFISMMFHSMFSFSFFISFFTPIFVAGATLRRPRRAGARTAGVRTIHLTEVK
ncbi:MULTISPECIES: hypothetical protein [unclassified Sulfitobacter]|uniref:hypothetical protein n=1 Tax=unclassified Sulfitobacter TaxID=196795 RepID=UPI003746FDA7